jgi:hypothetical protein
MGGLAPKRAPPEREEGGEEGKTRGDKTRTEDEKGRRRQPPLNFSVRVSFYFCFPFQGSFGSFSDGHSTGQACPEKTHLTFGRICLPGPIFGTSYEWVPLVGHLQR